jgi:putative peptidoglycan lipid II flippase
MTREPARGEPGAASGGGDHGLIRAAGVVGAATLLSRILGYLRDMTIALFFGAGLASDAFIAAFRIPSLLRELLGEGALSASFVPVFAAEAMRAGRARAMQLAGAAFSALAVATVALSLFGILLAPALVMLVAPGFRAIPGKWELTVTLTRWMFPFLCLVCLAALLGGLLNAQGHFATPALAPAVFNVGMIGMTVLMVPRVIPPVMALAWGVLAGGAAMLALQIPPSTRRGFPGPRWPHPADPGLRRIGRLMLPATAGLGVTQVNVFLSGLLASFLPQGSVSYLFYAMRLIQFPIGVIGVAIGTVALPSMSAMAARQAPALVTQTLTTGLRLAMFLTAPALVALGVFGRPMVRVLFERGAFTPEATAATSSVLLGYVVGLVFYVNNRILTSAFYAFHDTRTPFRTGVVAVAVNLLGGWLLMGSLQAPGLALATALASMANTGLLLRALRSHLGPWIDRSFLRALGRIALAAALAAGVAGAFLILLPAPGAGTLGGVVVLTGELLAVGIAYVVLAWCLGCEEVAWAARAVLPGGPRPSPGGRDHVYH